MKLRHRTTNAILILIAAILILIATALGLTAGTAAAASPPPPASTCNTRTGVLIGQSGGQTWTTWCGTGDKILNQYGAGSPFTALDEIRDASAPYHRIWLHGYIDPITGQPQPLTQCIYSGTDIVIPDIHVLVHDVYVSPNTSPC